MNRRLAALPLAILAALGVGAGIARVELPHRAFDLTYETYPLDESGAVDRAAAPTRYWYKDRRTRIDNFTSGAGRPVLESSFIMDCDSSRMIQVNWRDRTVMVTTFEEWQEGMKRMMDMASRYAGQIPAHQAAARPDTTGGLVTTTTTWRDTTAEREWFGLPARYVEYTESTTSSPDACYPSSGSRETRVWTTDLDLPLCIPPFDVTAIAMPTVSGGGGGCTDRHESSVVGRPRRIDFRLRSEEITIEGGRSRSSGFEVTSLSRAALADSLFLPPAGFERIDMEALFGGMAELDAHPELGGPANDPVPPKAEGVTRIGVALDMPPDAPADPRTTAREIADWIQGRRGYDAVPLAARDRAGALTEAPGIEADYVLVYRLDEVKAGVSKKGLLGGALGGAIGARAAGGVMKLEVKGTYELAAVPGGERVTREELDEERSTENPPQDLTKALTDAAGEALQALR